MSESEELLESLPEENYTAGSGSAERHIIIGRDKYITVPEELKNIAVQYDKDVETVTFDCPALWDEHELSKMAVYVNYIRADGKRARKICSQPVIDADDPNIMHFDWTVSKYATEVHGPIRFLVCIKGVDEEGHETVKWHSHINEDMYVSEGMECDDELEDAEKDIVTDLLLRMDRAESVLNMSWVNATDEKLEELDNAKVNRSGDTVTGDLAVQGALTTPNGATTPEKSTVEDGYSSRQTAKGANIVDGAITRVESIKGKTVKTTNLMVASKYESPNPYITNGITWEVDDDGIVSANGTSSSTAASTFTLCTVPVDSDMYVSGCPENGSTSTYAIIVYGNNSGTWIARDTGSGSVISKSMVDSYGDTGVIVRCVVFNGQTVNDLKFKPMVSEGTQARSFTPAFSGLKHAYIKSIKSTGRNLINVPDFELDGSAGPFVDLNLSGTLTLSCRVSGGESPLPTSAIVRIRVDGVDKYQSPTNVDSNGVLTLTVTGSKIDELGFLNWSQTVGTISEVMLNHGTTALPFEPYKEDTYELPEAVELGEFDEIDISSGKVIKGTYKLTIDGTENWVMNSAKSDETKLLAYLVLPVRTSSIHSDPSSALSNWGSFNYSDATNSPSSANSTKEAYAVAGSTQSLYLSIHTSRLENSDIDGLKAYLAERYNDGDPVVVEYRLETPTKTSIDIPKYYTAYDKGSETIVQGDVDNSQWGAVPTVVQEYSAMVDPKETATKGFVLNALADKLDKDATSVEAEKAKAIKSKTSGEAYEVEFVTHEEYEALEKAGTSDPTVVYIIKDHDDENNKATLYRHDITLSRSAFGVGTATPRISQVGKLDSCAGNYKISFTLYSSDPTPFTTVDMLYQQLSRSMSVFIETNFTEINGTVLGDGSPITYRGSGAMTVGEKYDYEYEDDIYPMFDCVLRGVFYGNGYSNDILSVNEPTGIEFWITVADEGEMITDTVTEA